MMLFLNSFFVVSQTQDSTKRSPEKRFYQRNAFKTLFVPVILIGYGLSVTEGNGLYSSRDAYSDIQYNFSGFHTKVDNYLQFAPTAAVYGLGLAGIKGVNNFLDKTIIYAMANVFTTGIVQGLKHTANEWRPDQSDHYSFPSGHTATAFAAAEFMHQEYKGKSVFYSIAGYTMAASTGILRMMNNEHWMSDVLVGAGIGMLSTKLSYLIYPWMKEKVFHKKIPDKVFLPHYDGYTAGVSFIYMIR